MNDNELAHSDEDIFSEDDNCNSSKTSTTVLDPLNCNKISEGRKYTQVTRLRKLLGTGVPPPPDKSNPDFPPDSFLDSYYSHVDELSAFRESSFSHGELQVSEPLVDSPMKEFDVYYNYDVTCEELEELGLLVCKRCILSETASTINPSYAQSNLTLSAKKRRKKGGWSASPKSRVSYLTRRTATFGVSQLAAIKAKPSNLNRIQILVPKARDGNSSKLKNSRDKPPKRALFQSPDKHQTPDFGKSRKIKLSNNIVCATESTRTPLNTVPINKECNSSSEKRKCSRSLFNAKASFQENETLPPHHKKKMLWAVSIALKAVGITMSNVKFKQYAANLFKSTSKVWQDSGGKITTNGVTSTSDQMLKIASNLISTLFPSLVCDVADNQNVSSEVFDTNVIGHLELPNASCGKRKRDKSVSPLKHKKPRS